MANTIKINHNEGVNQVNFKQNGVTATVKQVIYKQKDSNGCALWCAPYKLYIPEENPEYISSISVGRCYTEEPTIYSSDLSDGIEMLQSGTENYNINTTTYANTPWYRVYYNDKVYVQAAAAGVSYGNWFPVTSWSNINITSTGDSVEPNVTVYNYEGCSIQAKLSENNNWVSISSHGGSHTFNPSDWGETGIDLRLQQFRDIHNHSVQITPANTNIYNPVTITGNQHILVKGSRSTIQKGDSQFVTEHRDVLTHQSKYSVSFTVGSGCASGYTSTNSDATGGNASGIQYKYGSTVYYFTALKNNDDNYYYTPQANWVSVDSRKYRINSKVVSGPWTFQTQNAISTEYTYKINATLANAVVTWKSGEDQQQAAIGNTKQSLGTTLYFDVNPNAYYEIVSNGTRYYHGSGFPGSAVLNSTNFTLYPDKTSPNTNSNATYKSYPTPTKITYSLSSTNTGCSVSWTTGKYGDSVTGTITPETYYYRTTQSVSTTLNASNFNFYDVTKTAKYKTTISASKKKYTLYPTSEQGGTIAWKNTSGTAVSTISTGETVKLYITPSTSTGFRLKPSLNINSGDSVAFSTGNFTFSGANNVEGGQARYKTYDFFEAVPYTLTISNKPEGCSAITVKRTARSDAGSDAGANINVNLNNGSTIYHGDTLSVSATATASYWDLGGTGTRTVTGNTTITITSQLRTYPLQITIPEHCSSIFYMVSDSGTVYPGNYTTITYSTTKYVTYGKWVWLVVNPASSYIVQGVPSGWTLDGTRTFKAQMGTGGLTFTPTITLAGYTLTVRISNGIAELHLVINRVDYGTGVDEFVMSDSEYTVYPGDTVWVSEVATYSGYTLDTESYSPTYTITNSGLVIEPLAIAERYSVTINKPNYLSTVYYRQGTSGSFTSITSSRTINNITYGTKYQLYGTTASGQWPTLYNSPSHLYTHNVTGNNTITIPKAKQTNWIQTAGESDALDRWFIDELIYNQVTKEGPSYTGVWSIYCLVDYFSIRKTSDSNPDVIVSGVYGNDGQYLLFRDFNLYTEDNPAKDTFFTYMVDKAGMGRFVVKFMGNGTVRYYYY